MAHTHRIHVTAPDGTTPARGQAGQPAYQAYLILRGAFTVAPILFGADKFFHLLVNWDRYLAPQIANLSPFGVHQTMYVVGVIEIVAGIVVATAPRLGAWPRRTTPGSCPGAGAPPSWWADVSWTGPAGQCSGWWRRVR